jgi:hypothetical protein
VYPGTTEFEALEATPVPTELVAVTLKVYESLFVRPVRVQKSDPVVQVQVCPPPFV